MLVGFGGTSTDVNGGGTTWVVNNSTITSNPIANNVLTLTDGLGNELRSAFYNTKQSVATGFVASFTYQDVGGGGADGATFVLQNDPNGTAALGNGGGGLGYAADGLPAIITPSIAFEMNIYTAAAPHIVGTNLVNSATNPGVGVYNATGAVNFAGGDPIQVTLAYDPTTNTITETDTDTTTNGVYTTQYPGQNVAGILSSDSAYIGFTGGTGARPPRKRSAIFRIPEAAACTPTTSSCRPARPRRSTSAPMPPCRRSAWAL